MHTKVGGLHVGWVLMVACFGRFFACVYEDEDVLWNMAGSREVILAMKWRRFVKHF